MRSTPPLGVSPRRSRRSAAALLLMATAAATAVAVAAATATADGGGVSTGAAAAVGGAPPPPPASDSDDPTDAWAEWGETPESRRSGVRRRQRPIEAGMNVDALLGMAGKATKLFFTTLHPGVATTEDEALALGSRYRNMLAAGGVTASFFADGKGGLICQAGSFRDAVNAKDFLIRQPEVALVALDAAKFTPLPPEDDDDDDDEGAAGVGAVGGVGQPQANSGGEDNAGSAPNASEGEGGMGKKPPAADAAMADAGLSVESAATGEAQIGGSTAKEEL
ncbi:hypothetical protein MMPV_003024 [Pyropia vietnamensis]